MSSEEGIVSFDVGGRVYKVRRSLLESFPNTLLARLVADEWQGDDESKPIFIDRDSDRFRYCLDYMRDDQAVALPHTESKSAFLKDLEYYGFENVDPKRITVEFSVMGANDCLALFDKTTGDAIHSTKVRLQCMEAARFLYEDYQKNRCLEIFIPHKSEEKCRLMSNSLTNHEVLLNECMKQYELKIASHCYTQKPGRHGEIFGLNVTLQRLA